MELRDALGPNTFVLGYSNGIVQLPATPQISREGGMEAKVGYKNYLLPSELPGEWEPQIRQRVLQQATRLASSAVENRT